MCSVGMGKQCIRKSNMPIIKNANILEKSIWWLLRLMHCTFYMYLSQLDPSREFHFNYQKTTCSICLQHDCHRFNRAGLGGASFLRKAGWQPVLTSDTVHDISDVLGNGSRVLIHRNSTSGAIRLHASFGQPSSSMRTRKCNDNGPFSLDNDDGYVGVFFDTNSNEWAGADKMTSDQVPAVSDKG
jgi:hypothetical protein